MSALRRFLRGWEVEIIFVGIPVVLIAVFMFALFSGQDRRLEQRRAATAAAGVRAETHRQDGQTITVWHFPGATCYQSYQALSCVATAPAEAKP